MNKHMKLAIKEAQKGISLGHGGPFGAVIVKDNKVISKGHNHVVANNDPTCHGEIDAITAATISSRAFLESIRNAHKAYQEYINQQNISTNE